MLEVEDCLAEIADNSYAHQVANAQHTTHNMTAAGPENASFCTHQPVNLLNPDRVLLKVSLRLRPADGFPKVDTG